jgi:hypothetical protein
MLSTALEVLGAALIVAGIWWLAGPPWAFVAAGAFGLAFGFILGLPPSGDE